MYILALLFASLLLKGCRRRRELDGAAGVDGQDAVLIGAHVLPGGHYGRGILGPVCAASESAGGDVAGRFAENTDGKKVGRKPWRDFRLSILWVFQVWMLTWCIRI